jgi:TonB-linked SusC/RagA family outer membrane protein
MAASLMQVYATGYTQSAKISLTLKNVSLKQALKEIEKQSDYTFVYSDSKIDVNKKIDINVKDCALVEVLDQLIADSEIRYTSIDNHIVLTGKKNMIYRLPAIPHEAILNREVIDMESISPIRNVLLQQVSVTGQVTSSADGQPLPGVNVIVKGTTLGTTTDINGAFTLNVPDPNVTLVLSFVGFQTQEVALAGQKSINVTLVEETQELQEIVVVGYGTRMKEELTGAVSTVSDKQMKISPATSVVSRMQGQVSGVTITSANRPGGDATIRIRGIGTINDPNPLYVIDGVPVGPGNNLNPSDIESISVLKDASSAAIYGSRGANGVIIITTKKGRQNQKPTITASVRTGITKATNQYDLLNTEEYGRALWLSAKNRGVENYSHPQYGSGATPVIPDYILPAGAKTGDPAADPSLYKYPDYVIFEANKQGTDWYKEIYQNGVIQEYDIAVSGGGNNTTYAFSANYLDEEGIVKYTDFQRFNFRINLESSFNKWLKFGQSLQAIYINEHGALGDNEEGIAISNAYRSQPIIPVYDIMGNFAGSKAAGMGNSANPLAQLYRARNNNGKWMRGMGNTYAEATLLKGLTIKSLLGYNFGIWNYKGYGIPNYEHSEPNRVANMNATSNYSIFWNWINTVNYTTTIADIHRISIVAGTEAMKNTWQEMTASRSQYFSETPEYMQLNSGELNKDNGGTGSIWSTFSQLGRVNYDLMGKYNLEATIRRDGSSRFGKNTRYGVFPAASAGWAISQENFMSGTKGWLDLLRVRAGWGTAGNDRIGEYNMYSTYATNNYMAAYPITGSNTSAVAGFQPSTVGSDDVSWETTKTINVGLDGTFLNNKITFSLDIWKRNTTDMLYRLSVPEVMGLATPPFVNIGEMENKGFDIELGYRNSLMDGKFTYAVNLTASHYKNEIVSLSDKVKETIYQTERQVQYSAATLGHAFPEFYGFIVDGIYQSDAEAAAGPQYDDYNAAGHFKFRDLNGDGLIKPSDDRTFIGSPHPDLTGGLNIDLGYAGFDLNMFFYGSYGNEMINYVSRWIDYGQFNGGLSKDALYDSWTPENKGARLPMLDQNSYSQQASSAFVEDGSFLRLKSLRLGYSFPQSLTQKAKLQSLRLYVQATNLFTITKYSGLDPELNASGMSMGLDRGAWPTPRQIMFGITVGL